ncbi:MAG: ADP-ribosylglycohydrolase family protein [Candidatus Helarchaeota archaeon]|nr:ADP-ribosylglycohydrolase family protein [Candidatus Helarchaeota archaeon]
MSVKDVIEMEISKKDYYNKVYGGWLGRCIGSQLGAPLEIRPYFYIQRKYAGLDNYVKKITGKEVNDDEMYEIVALLTLEQHGIDFTVEQLGEDWKNRLWKLNFTAEKAALKNLRKGLQPPQTGIQNNPFYDFIGAQMRGEIWGLISPGCPDIAAKYAKLDASISHVGEGVLGEVFIAGLVALSFIKQDPKELIQEVLNQFIPKTSLYRSIVEKCLNWAELYSNWKLTRKKLMSAWRTIRKSLGKQARSTKRKLFLKGPKIHEIHVLPNAGIVTLGLMYGQGDFEKSICTTALCGYDTDCNVGNVGAILGVQLGADGIPPKWKDPIKDTFNTYVRGFQETRISKIAERISRIGEAVIKSKCPNIQLD